MLELLRVVVCHRILSDRLLAGRQGRARIAAIAVFFAAASLTVGRVVAQDATASLTGVVVDESGAAIAGVEVIAVGTTSGLQRSVMSGADGTFAIPLLPPGTYVVTAQREGFAAAQAQDVAVTAGRATPLRIQLKLDTRRENVVVTAQKREERVQDVPIAMTVLQGDRLDQSTSGGVLDAVGNTPGVALFIGPLGAANQLAVRGVAASAPLFTGSSPVAYYVDSVPFSLVKTAILPDTSSFDLERVEVLRGPQGTLYGASAQNGVVRILTKEANLDTFELKSRVSVSSTEDGGPNSRVDMAVNLPLVPHKVGVRAVLGYEGASGWIDRPNRKDANDARLRNLRLKVNTQPAERLSLGASMWRGRSDYGAPSYSLNNRNIDITTGEPVITNFNAYGVKIGYSFRSLAITSATSYIDYYNYSDYLIGLNGGPILSTTNTSKVLTQDVYLNSTGRGPWRWTAGGSYRRGRDRLLQTLAPPPTDWAEESTSSAFFGELTRELGPLAITGGLRHFADDVTQLENSSGTLPPSPLYRRDNTFHKWSPRVVLTWHPGGETNLYTSYSEGFRSGSAQNASVARLAPNFPPIRPDNLKNYEVGLKRTFGHGRADVDAAVYYIDWTDVQQNLTVPSGNGVTFFAANVNGVSASGMGFDFAATTRPASGWTVGANASWNNLTEDADVITKPAAAPNGVVLFSKGTRLTYSPEFTAGAFAGYAFPLQRGYAGRLSASVNHISEQVFRRLVGTDVLVIPGDPMTIGRIGASLDAPTRWTATFYIDNLNNEQGAPQKNGGGGRVDRDMHIRPRTVGLQLEYHF